MGTGSVITRFKIMASYILLERHVFFYHSSTVPEFGSMPSNTPFLVVVMIAISLFPICLAVCLCPTHMYRKGKRSAKTLSKRSPTPYPQNHGALIRAQISSLSKHLDEAHPNQSKKLQPKDNQAAQSPPTPKPKPNPSHAALIDERNQQRQQLASKQQAHEH